MSIRNDPEALYDRLIEEGLFEESSGELGLTDEFRRRREESATTLAALDEAALEERVTAYVAETDVEADDVSADLLADAIAVSETCESLDRETSLYVASSLERSESDERDPHLPAGFLSLSADEIDPFVANHPTSIVYFWREDCPPCRAVKADLERLRRDGVIPSSMGLGAVFGPDYARTLRERYEVGAAPTILFCSADGIEARIVGNPGVESLQTEIEILLEDHDA